MDDERGQALIEFVAFAPVIAFALLDSAYLLRESFRRTECSRLVFEAVRTRLEDPRFYSRAGVELRATEDGIEGSCQCGKHREALFLPRIDRRKPGA